MAAARNFQDIIEIEDDDDGGEQFFPFEGLLDLEDGGIKHTASSGPALRDSTNTLSNYETCLSEILEVFPDISRDHVQQKYDKWVQSLDNQQHRNLSVAQDLIESILDGGNYPKEKDRIKELKRKRSGRNSEEDEAARWKYAHLRDNSTQYIRVAHAALKETFNYVPDKFIHDTLKEQGHYYGTFFAILEAQRELSSARRPPFTLLKNRRASSNPSSSALMEQLRQDGYDFDALVKEIESAKQRRIREDAKRKAEKEIAEAEVAKDQEHRRKGDLIECGCCFDEVVIPKVTHCNGDEPHFFCLECARNNANNDIGNSRYQLHCMDGSGCRATFSREQRNRFLDSKTTEKLERLQQQNEIRLAELPNLSNCPFCDFAAICPPVDVDKEFHCHNPDCEEVSCRLCKLKSHIPLTCEEFKKEQGVSERRVIEEARTEALIRTCGKCKVRILKEDGCNKVVCTSCHAILCDYCGQDISKAMYNHFDGQGRAPPGLVVNAGGKCPLYDESNKRKDQQVERAEEDATAKVRAEHPELSAEDLKIKFAKSVQSSSDRHHNSHHARANQNLPPLNHPRDYMFYPGANPPAANVLGRYELEAMEVHNKRRHLAHAVRDYEDVQHMAQRQRNVNQHRHVVDLDPTTVLNNQLPPRPRRRHAVADPNNYIPERTYDDHAFGIH